MASSVPDYVNLTRICEFTRRLHQLHRLGGEDAIDQEFSAVCRAVWGFTLDDFTDEDLSAEDHAWLDDLTRECAIEFAAAQGYDLRNYVHGGCVAGWWGFMLAEARGVLTAKRRAPLGAGKVGRRGGDNMLIGDAPAAGRRAPAQIASGLRKTVSGASTLIWTAEKALLG